MKQSLLDFLKMNSKLITSEEILDNNYGGRRNFWTRSNFLLSKLFECPFT